MDYFFVGNHVNNVGLQDAFAKGKWSVGKHSGGVDVHYFLTAADLVNTMDGTVMDSQLGTEVDVTWGYKVSPKVAINAGYSQLFATESMESLKQGNKDNITSWGWLMLTFKPDFLAKKNNEN